MEHITSFRDLKVWRLAMEVAVECYALTQTFPPEERYGLRRELRRSAVSIPSNIAEGHNRRGRRAYLNHINIARDRRQSWTASWNLPFVLDSSRAEASEYFRKSSLALGKCCTASREVWRPVACGALSQVR